MRALVKMTKLVLPKMKEARRGVVVNVSSFEGAITAPFYAVYGASKAFVDSFSKSMAVELQGTGVKCATHPALLVATKERRALINMPTKSARWCGRPPWTLNCVYEPWTHCPVPAVENLTIVKWSHRMTWKPQHAPDTPDVVRVMTTQLHKEVGFQHVRVAETTRGAAYEVLFTPRQWVRDAAACAMAAASLRDGGFVVTHVRISEEKKRERGAALPGLNAYFPATAVALRRANSSTVFLQTATPIALERMTSWTAERHVALSYTRSERAEHDLWVGALGAGV